MYSSKIGDLVWAKMKGFPPWPGIVVTPPKDVKLGKKPAGNKCIYFFGTKNYGWIEEANLKPYNDFKEEFTKAKNLKNFKEALLEIEEVSEKGSTFVFKPSSPLQNESNNITDPPEDLPPVKTPKPKAKNVTFNASSSKVSKSLKSAATNKETAGVSPVKRNPKKLNKTESDDEPVVDFSLKRKGPRKRYSDPGLGFGKKRMLSFPVADTTTPSVSHSKWPERSSTEKSKLSKSDADVNSASNEKPAGADKRAEPGEFKVGFIGLGNIGSAVVKNLVKANHRIIIWNRTIDKCKEFPSEIEVASTPEELVILSDVICCCVSDADAAKEIVFGSNGILSRMNNKCLIQMTGLDIEASLDISEAITSTGGRYLEAPIHGSKKEAEDKSLIALTAGDITLFEKFSCIFECYAKRATFLGDVGNASKMYTVLQLITGITLAGLAEGVALAEKAGVQGDLLEILSMSAFNCPLINETCEAIKNSDYSAKLALRHQQKDLNLALVLAESIAQPVPLVAASNELFKHAKRLGYGEHDAAAVLMRSRFT